MLLKILCAWLIAWSLAAFITMGADKRRAKQGLRRVPEKTLFLLAIVGGALGAFLGMHVFHHKTKHWYFRLGFPLLVLAWAGLLAWLHFGPGLI